MSALQSHKDLIVWKKAILLAGEVYNATSELPDDERYGLTRQIRRCAVSVASNIAEGAARGRKAEFIHFLSIARGSLTELETQVLIATNLKMLSRHLELQTSISEVGRLLTALIRKLTEQRTFQTQSRERNLGANYPRSAIRDPLL
jgi:four helix bundle protein